MKIEMTDGYYEKGFSNDNTEGYTDLQLDEMNRQLEEALPAQPVDSDAYKNLCEKILRAF